MVRRLRLLVLLPLLVCCFFLVGCLPILVYAAPTWTYNVVTNTATASGSGSTDFAALVAADAAGGWGVYTADATGTQVICGGKIVIGDGVNVCAFADSGKQVYFKQGCITANYQNFINVSDKSTLTLGTLVSSTLKTAKFGCDIKADSKTAGTAYSAKIINAASKAAVYLYSCTVTGVASGSAYYYSVFGNTSSQVYQCVFDNCALESCTGDYDTVVGSGNPFYFVNNPLSTGTWNHIYLRGAVSFFRYFGAASSTFSNVICSGSSANSVIMYNQNNNETLVDVEMNNWGLNWIGTSSGVLLRQYTFNLTVLNGDITDVVENANVTLWKNNIKLGSWLTDSDGKIPTQTLLYGYYNQGNGSSIQEGGYPFVMNVTHGDWADYTSRFYVTEKTQMVISMQNKTVIDSDVYLTADEGMSLAFAFGVVGCIVAVVLAVVFVRRSN